MPRMRTLNIRRVIVIPEQGSVVAFECEVHGVRPAIAVIRPNIRGVKNQLG